MMKGILISLIILLAVSWINAQTDGVLTVTATTSNAGGNFEPKNIVAIWIEDEQGNFVKTLLAYAQNRKTHLNTWEASTTAAGSPFNIVDAISGATRTSHATRTCTWNSTDINGTLMPDGIYKVWMELTDKNSTGNFSSFNFTKGADPNNQTPLNVPSFSSISINWEPVITFIGDKTYGDSFKVYPNPTSGIFHITGENITKVQIRNVFGGLIYNSSAPTVNISAQPDGIYFIEIITNKGTVTKKILKNSL